MSTSELRRGPGWWMDLEGQWNPPEEWPEATPPLPGWIRGADGLWSDPNASPAHEIEDIEDRGSTPPQRPVPEARTIPSLESISEPESNEHTSASSSQNGRTVAEVLGTDRRVGERRADPTPGQSALTFAEATAHIPVVADDYVRLRRQGITASLLAAVTASMLAAGLVLLLLLL